MNGGDGEDYHGGDAVNNHGDIIDIDLNASDSDDSDSSMMSSIGSDEENSSDDDGESEDEYNIHGRYCFDEDILAKVRSNDPDITCVDLGDWGGFSGNIKWDRSEMDIFSGNTHLLKLGIVGGYSRFFCRHLSKNRSIEHLKIAKLGPFTRDIFNELGDFFQHNTKLRCLEVNRCTPLNVGTEVDPTPGMVAPGIVVISTVLRRHFMEDGKSLEHVKFVGDGLADDSAQMLINALSKYHEKLIKLDLRVNHVGKLGCAAIAQLLQKPSCKLEELALDENKIDDDAATLLGQALKVNTTLKILLLRENNIGDLGLTSLSEGLLHNTSLRTLSLGSNPAITNAGWKSFSKCLGSEGVALLETLMICGVGRREPLCNIDDEGIDILATALASNKTIQLLDLSWNGKISPEGWTAFFRSMNIWNNVVEELNLAATRIRDEQIALLANALINNDKLKVLRLDYNFAVNEWRPFVSLLQSPVSVLEELYIGNHGSYFDDVAPNEIAEALANNTKLKVLSLGDNVEFICEWDSFSKMLCDTTSIATIYNNSNHTLECILPTKSQYVSMYCMTNREENKFAVARNKILYTHQYDKFADVMKEFVGMDFNVLPHALAWSAIDSSYGCHVLYQFVRKVPSLLETGKTVLAAPGKRKRSGGSK